MTKENASVTFCHTVSNTVTLDTPSRAGGLASKLPDKFHILFEISLPKHAQEKWLDVLLSLVLVRFFLDIFCTFFSDGAWHISYFNFSSFSDQGHLRHMMDMKLSLLLRPEILLTLFSFLSENLTPTNISAVSLLWLFLLDTSTDVLIFVYLYCIVFVLTPLVGVFHKYDLNIFLVYIAVHTTSISDLVTEWVIELLVAWFSRFHSTLE